METVDSGTRAVRRRAGPRALLGAAAATAVCAAAALVGPARAAGEDSGAAPLPPPEPGQAPAGLHLVARSPKQTIRPGQTPAVTVHVVNRSKEATIPVVRPGDGSESGWREPSMAWRAFLVAPDGTERPVERLPLMRCGNFAADWTLDVTDLAPGAEFDATGGPAPLSAVYDFQEAGRYRLRAVYEYEAGASARGGKVRADGKPETGRMGATAPFEMTSDAVEFTVERPFDVVVRMRRPARVGERSRPEDFLEVAAVGTGGGDVVIERGAWELTWELERSTATPADWDEGRLDPAPEDRAVTRGREVPLTGARSGVRRTTYPWTFDRVGTFRVAARLSELRDGGARVRSKVTEVDVVE